MQLVTKELRQKLPAIGATEKQKDPIAQVKFFTPDGNWTWWVLEWDGADTCFGAVAGQVFELGYFRISELDQVRNRLGLPIERDLYFKPTPLSEIRKQYAR